MDPTPQGVGGLCTHPLSQQPEPVGYSRLWDPQIHGIVKSSTGLGWEALWGLFFSFIPSQPFLFTVFLLSTETILSPPEFGAAKVQQSSFAFRQLQLSFSLSKIRENGAELLCEGLRGGHKSQISPFPSKNLVFLAIPWFSPGLLCPGMRRMLRGLSLLLLQVLHPPTPSPVPQLPGLLNVGFKASL